MRKIAKNCENCEKLRKIDMVFPYGEKDLEIYTKKINKFSDSLG